MAGRLDDNHRTHLAVLTALSRISADVPALAALLADADDDADAIGRLQEAYDLSPIAAQSVLDAQFKLLTRARRAELDRELHEFREALAAPWDPPLEVPATMHSPRRVVVLIAGEAHEVTGRGLRDSVDRVVVLVRELLAAPRRRRVAVTVSGGPAKAPTRILVDPVASTLFFYDGERETD
jgi:hypothetical protein